MQQIGGIDSKVFTPDYSNISLNFSDGPGAMYGIFTFNDKNFSKSIQYDNSGWSAGYVIYKVIGIKF